MINKKLLIISMKHSYGDSSQPYSYEWNHFYLGLKPNFSEIDFFDFMEESKLGKAEMQKKLLEKVKSFQPNILLVIPYTNQLDTDFIQSLRQYTKVCGFFHDDSWRQDLVQAWAPCLDVFTTSDIKGVEKYKKQGLINAVYLPFGVNENLFKKDPMQPKDIDVSFVGSWHPYREWLLNKLIKQNINVEIYGSGWRGGILDEASMINVMQRSKICLNLSNSVNYDIRYLLSSPRAVINTLRSPKNKEQIKGRNFEIPACGSMQLSYFVEGLEALFKFGDEVVIFNSPEEFVEKTQYYLANSDEREKIAEAGYQRVRFEHTYAKKFLTIFENLIWI